MWANRRSWVSPYPFALPSLSAAFSAFGAIRLRRVAFWAKQELRTCNTVILHIGGILDRIDKRRPALIPCLFVVTIQDTLFNLRTCAEFPSGDFWLRSSSLAPRTYHRMNFWSFASGPSGVAVAGSPRRAAVSIGVGGGAWRANRWAPRQPNEQRRPIPPSG